MRMFPPCRGGVEMLRGKMKALLQSRRIQATFRKNGEKKNSKLSFFGEREHSFKLLYMVPPPFVH